MVDEIIQITNVDNISNYTFGIDTNFENTGYIENLHIKEVDQGYIAYIMRYQPAEGWEDNLENYTPEGDLVLNVSNFNGQISKHTIDGQEVWTTETDMYSRSVTVEDCTYSLVEYCSNEWSGNPNGDPHVRGPNCQGPYHTEVVETCVTITVGGGGDPADDDNHYGGGTSNSDDCTDTTGTLIVDDQPISGLRTGCSTNEETGVSQPTSRKRDCNKIENFVLATDTTYISKVRNLKNLDELPFESAVTMTVDGTIEEYVGTENNGQVDIPENPNSDYTAISHVHNQTTKPTYSVFSLSDLAKMAKIYKAGYIRGGKFVAFISTGDDTHYALTISNATKFLEFFSYKKMYDLNITPEEREIATDKIIEINPLLEIYYLNDNSLIKEKQNSTTSLKLFMEFLDKANMGVTIFEADENFETFKELSINEQGTVERAEPCEF